jgi:phosphatidylglycerol---prolipoprotein diacylglyceryl transferase
MLPTLALGPLHISTYALVYAVAIVGCGMLAFHRLLASGSPAGWVVEGLGLTVLAGMVGTVVGFALIRWVTGPSPIGTFALHLRSGSTIFGALTFGGLAGLGYCRWRGISAGEHFDRGIVALPLGQAIGRIGCLLAGCCYGRETDSWLGMKLPDTAGIWAVRYPTQLLSSAADLAIFAALLAVERRGSRAVGATGRWPFPGSLTLLFGGLYFAKRFALEFLRGDNAVVLPPLTWAHLLCLFGLALAAVLLAVNLAQAGGARRRST